MADQQPGDSAPAAGMPDPTLFAGSGELPTTDVPDRWSGAAPVPDVAPRRSLWSRMVDRVNGTGPDPDDDRTAVPAVDPWADQDTPVWADPYATAPGQQARAGVAGTPPTRLDVAGTPPTRLDAPGAVAAGLGPPATAPSSAGAPSSAAAPAPASGLPAPGTYPPPAAGGGLPPLLAPKIRAWGRRAAARSQQAAADAPGKLRVLGQQAAAAGQQVAAKGQQVAAGAPEKIRQAAGGTQDRIRQAASGAPRKLSLLGRSPAGRPPVAPIQRRPPWTPPAPGPARRPRRKRRLRRSVALVIIVLGLAYWFVPGVRQYPVTAVLPSSFADLELRDNAAGQRAAQRLAEKLQEAGAGGGAFAGVYSDDRGKRVTVFGVTGLRLTPGSDVKAQLDRLSDAIALKNVQSYDIGGFAGFGAQQECGVGRLDGTSVVACTWADHGSLATVLLTRRSVSESAALVTRLRDAVLKP